MARGAGDGHAQEEHLRALAQRGNKEAQALLAGPELPEALAYLWSDFQWLRAGAGEGTYGLAPLAYPTITAWAELMGKNPTPMEVEGFLRLDAAMRDELRPPSPSPHG